jgi:hypothetical protein
MIDRYIQDKIPPALTVAGKCRDLVTQLSQICRNNKEEVANGCLVLFVASGVIRNSVILLCIE